MRRALLLFIAPFIALFADQSVFFSPHDHLADQLVSLIDKESSRISIAVYQLTSEQIASALCSAKKRGVVVDLVVHMPGKKLSKALEMIEKEGIAIHSFDVKDGKKRVLMHHKFALFEKQQASWTGSFNFTYSADQLNRENAVLFQDVDVYKTYMDEFSKVLKEADEKS